MHSPTQEERALLIRDKYDGDQSADLTEDLARLSAGEPLAYVIGWIPFLGLRIGLQSRPLIPRPETEWWAEELVKHCRERFGDSPFTLLDLCAGSGAVGLAVLAAFPNARVSFGELVPEHVLQIRETLRENGLAEERADIRESDLFGAFKGEQFSLIATNPPYIPDARVLEASVTSYEPALALYSGADGLSLIRKITSEAPAHLLSTGELWMECDTENVEEAGILLSQAGAVRTEIRTDLYGRPRLAVGYYA